MGRPETYKPEYAKQAQGLCELGATDWELAKFFTVDTATIYRWRNYHRDFCDATKAGKEAADDRVERALFGRAVGYSFESEKVFQFQGEVVRAKTVEHVPPDPGAAMQWLKNRRGEVWRDKTEVVIKHEASGLSDDDLARIAGGSGERAAETPGSPSKLN
jgi:hypothetical protein